MNQKNRKLECRELDALEHKNEGRKDQHETNKQKKRKKNWEEKKMEY